MVCLLYVTAKSPCHSACSQKTFVVEKPYTLCFVGRQRLVRADSLRFDLTAATQESRSNGLSV